MLKLDIQMFADGKVVIDTDLDNKGFKDGLDKMQSLAKTGFTAVASAVGVVSTAMAGAVGFGVKYNATIEQLTTSFAVMTGSTEEAVSLVERLKKVGAETPYELTGLAQTVQLLMQYGMSAEEAYQSTISLGDIAQGSAEKMQGIALALGQMSSYGKVTLQDIKQMIGNGFNPLQEISERTGESMESLYDRISAGTISVDEIKESFANASAEGGRFYQSMEKQSQTIAGQFSTLKDNASSLAGTLTEGISGVIATNVLPSINGMLQTLETAFTEGGFEGFAEKLGQVVAEAITSISEQAPKFIELAVTIIQNLITGIQNNLPTIVKGAMSIISTLIKTMLNMLPQLLQMGIDIILELARGISEEAPTLIPQMIEVLIEMINVLLDNIDTIAEVAIELIIALSEGIMNALPILVERLPELIIKLAQALLKLIIIHIPNLGIKLVESLINGLFSYWEVMLNKVKEFFKGTIFEGLVNKVTDMMSVGINLVKGLWKGISNSYNWIKDKIQGWVGNVLKFIKKIFGISSPSKVMRDEVGKYMAEGIGVGFDEELNDVYNNMRKAINMENAKIQSNVEMGKVFNTLQNTTPIAINIDADVEMDGQKVGRLVTPTITRTIKNGGGV